MALAARPPPGLPPKASALVENQTLYIRNLPDKLPKDDLKRSLYMLFATYGVILDIVALKTAKMRGQAHVVFRDIDSSTQAMRALDGSSFFGKDMSIAYGKGRSNTISKLAGTFTLPGKEVVATEDGQQGGADAIGFAAVPEKAVPVNQPERAKGTKRGREEDEEEEEEEDKDDSSSDDDEMQISESDEED